ncbi:asparagine synthetase B family protein [Spirulina subsalsa]|uniref:asparagine synthetase B family protein n=1 Tax=Spirulina subsalsa TaxID=54311 RepID=UPI00036D4FA9|nr:asparagine synthetase B [Spirulina subsalsa]
MSGICGIWHRDRSPLDSSILHRMTEFLVYRGRDSTHCWQQAEIGFGHTLLHCHQDSQPDGICHLPPFSLTADVRLDNRRALVTQLQQNDCPVTLHTSDSQLLLWAYHTWGKACLDYLLGDYVFALWDSQAQQLWCVRDPLGVKPFFFAQVGSLFLFSNTLNALRLHPAVSTQLNEEAIADFLLFDFNQTPQTTVFQDIQRLPGGHTLTCTPQHFNLQRYWTLPIPEFLPYRRDEDYLEPFQHLMNQAVSDRLRRREAALFLSGGLDSTMLAQTALNAMPEVNYQAFTVIYRELFKDPEGDYAQIVANSLHLPLKLIPADHYVPFEGWQNPAFHPPEPYNIPFLTQDYSVYQQVLTHSPVVLYGQGSDEGMRPSPLTELCRGMPLGELLRGLKRTLWHAHLKPPLGTGILGKLRGSHRDIWQGYPQWLNPDFERRYELRDRWQTFAQPQPPSPHPWRSKAYSDLLQPLWWYNFEATDPGFSRVPLEVRYPFLDLRLLNYLLSLSPLPWFINKHLLRVTLQKHLPPTIWQRPKTPLAGDPVYIYLQKGLQPWQSAQQQHREFLTTYIDLDALFCFTQQPNLPPPLAWSSLRPVSLGYWLKHCKLPHSALRKDRTSNNNSRTV